MAFENIEKGSLSEALDDSYYQPNTIKLKPESRERYEQNLAKISVSIRNTKHEKIIVGETLNASLHFDITNDVIAGDSKPINLTEKMVDVVFKKHDRYVEKEKEIFNGTEVNTQKTEEVDIEYDEKPINSIELAVEEKEDTMELPFTIVEKVENIVMPEEEKEPEIDFSSSEDSSAYQDEVNNELPSSTPEMEDNIYSLSQTVNKFIDLANIETRATNELSDVKEKISNSSIELNELKEQENDEIVRQYNLEKAIKIESERQKEILQRQIENTNTRIFTLNNEKANADIEYEKINTEIAETNDSIDAIKKKNEILESIVNGIIDSQSNSATEEENLFRKIA